MAMHDDQIKRIYLVLAIIRTAVSVANLLIVLAALA
jgi:hypothetical protein